MANDPVKLTGLTLATPKLDYDDLMYVVTDVDTVPSSRAVTVADLFTNVDIIGKLAVGAEVNNLALQLTQSVTGASQAQMAQWNATWDTSNPVTAFAVNIQNTASGAGSLVADWEVAGPDTIPRPVFSVSKEGDLTIGRNFSLAGDIVDENLGPLLAFTPDANGLYGLKLATAPLGGTVALGVTGPAAGDDPIAGTPLSISAAAAVDGLVNPGNADGGSLHLLTGAKVGSGVKGSVYLDAPTGGALRFTGPTASRTFTLPDADRTLATTAAKLSDFAATSSAELAGVISDETGSGALVFGTSPTLNSITVSAAANATPLTISGGSITGSDVHPFEDISGTWNTSGNVTGFKRTITNTASGASSVFFDYKLGSVSLLKLLTTGEMQLSVSNGGTTIDFLPGSSRAAMGTSTDDPFCIFTNNGNYDFTFYQNVFKGRTSSQIGFSTSATDSNSGTGPFWSQGAGSPEAAVTAPLGSIYSRNDGGILTTLYVKSTGSGNTGWVGIG